MSKIIFVLGGARSGKSTFAMQLAQRAGGRVAYIATAQALDAEMKRRIKVHKQSRPRTWKTFEEPVRVAKIIRSVHGAADVILLDCLTLLVSNMVLIGIDERKILDEMTGICRLLKRGSASAILVSNEVGLGIVPDNKLARDFRDIAGRVNQCVARHADEVHMMCAGLSIRLK